MSHKLLGLVTLTVAVGLLALDFSGVIHRIGTGGGRTVRAEFADAQQLRTGDLVRLRGVDVGRVTGIETHRGTATVSMSVEDSALPLHADARAALRWRTALGASFAVYLDPGTPVSGDLGSNVIPRSRTSGQVEVEDLASIDRGAARDGLQALPGELSEALRSAQEPARALKTLADVSPSVAKGVGALRGHQLDTDLRTLVSATSATVRALDTPTDDVRGLVAGAAATLQTTAARRADIRTTIAQAPGVLQRIELTLARLDTTLGLADPLVASLQAPAGQVAPTLAALRPTVVDAESLLRRAVPLLRSLRPAVSSLADTARAGRPLLDDLTPSLARMDKTILPYLAEKDPETQHTTTEMIGPTFTGVGSGAAGQMDGNGHFIRFPATIGSSPGYLPCQIYAGNPSSPELAKCKSLQEALETYLSYNPFGPAPGTEPPPEEERKK